MNFGLANDAAKRTDPGKQSLDVVALKIFFKAIYLPSVCAMPAGAPAPTRRPTRLRP
jgi:hypothetical protein